MGADTIKRIAHKLGLTRERRRELSDIISETAVVESTFKESGVYPPMPTEPFGGKHFEIGASCFYTNYFVKFRCEATPLEVNDEFLYRTLHAGDKVNLSYKTISEVIYDYVGDDYSKKQELPESRSIVGRKLESAEKITG
jgi:hypothetical protein